jgi:ABC-2 type transport system permease protein
MLLFVPSLLLSLLAWVFDGDPHVFDRIGAPLLAVFPFVTMFLVTSVVTLRERTSGTLERLLAMPMAKLDLLVGYAIAFSIVALVQVGLAAGLALGPLGLDVPGSVALVVVVAMLDAVLGVALGLFVSAFASTEFQAVQFMPAIVLPQFLLCGLLAPRDEMATPLSWLSNALPLSYAVDAMNRLSTTADVTRAVIADLVIVAGCSLVALLVGAATLRRRT